MLSSCTRSKGLDENFQGRAATDNAFDRLQPLIKNYIGLGGGSVCLNSESEIYDVLFSPKWMKSNENTIPSQSLITKPQFLRDYFVDGWGRIILVKVDVNSITSVVIVSRGSDLFEPSDDIVLKYEVVTSEAVQDAKRFRNAPADESNGSGLNGT